MNTAKLLLSENLITNDQYEQAFLDRKSQGGTIGYHLVRRHLITSKKLVEFQMAHLGMPRQHGNSLQQIPDNIISIIPAELARAQRILPVSKSSNILTLGMTDPVDDDSLNAISLLLDLVIRPVLVAEEDMSLALDRYYPIVKGASPRDTKPRIPQPQKAILLTENRNETTMAARTTMSWGINIEDALVNAVKISSARTEDKPVIISSPEAGMENGVSSNTVSPSLKNTPAIPSPGWDTNEDTKDNKTVPSPSPIEDPFASHHERPTPILPEQLISDGFDAAVNTETLIHNERPTVVPTSTPPALEMDLKPIDAADVRDSWSDVAPAQNPHFAATVAPRSYHSISPNPSVMEARMSLLPPHKAHMRTEGELLHEIFSTENLDELISLALEYMLRFSGRALFLVVRKTEIRGYHVAGEYTSREAVRTFWIPFNRRSTLGQVAISGDTYLGPIGDKPADDVFCAALGGRPSHALVVPIILRNRTVGILFADQVQTQEIAWPRLNRLTEAITASLTRFIIKEKHKNE